MRPIDKFLSALESRTKVTRHRNQWKACCPAHEDRDPSLSVAETPDGRVLVHCFAGCEVGEIAGALGLTVTELFPDDPKPMKPDLSREKTVLRIAQGMKERGEKLSPLDLNRVELALHRIKTVEAM